MTILFLGTQLKRKANLTTYVSPLRLPKRRMWVRPGMVCSVAGWGRLSANSLSGAEKLHEVELEIQKDKQCISLFKHRYNSTTQMCVGNPRKRKSSFKVRSPPLSMPSPGTAMF